ncbi:M48 family metallopeptidase [Chloroflexota bacterium]
MWEQIRSNRIKSVILVMAMGSLLFAIGWLLGAAFMGNGIAGLIIALVIWFIMNLVAYFSGDSLLLGISKAKKIKHEDHPRLFNIVEEMKIASGLAYMPSIYIIDTPAMNAFATGRDPKHASVAITAGLLQKLNRDELQGVIAHEMAHIKNRDVLLMSLCSVLLGTIVILAWYASRIMIYGAIAGGGRSRRSSGGGGGQGQIIIFVLAIVLMIVAPLLAYLIYFAISRKREYLADASAAQYTRYPEGLASALEKLSQSTNKLETANKATAPMFIINPLNRTKKKAAANLSSTHPPITERIRILRSMSGGASFNDYNSAYSAVHSGKSVVGAKALAGVTPVAMRKAGVPIAMAGAIAAATAKPTPEPTRIERARETSDVLWKYSKHKLVNCQCGTKLRVPPNYKHSNIKCPHCGRINTIPR